MIDVVFTGTRCNDNTVLHPTGSLRISVEWSHAIKFHHADVLSAKNLFIGLTLEQIVFQDNCGTRLRVFQQFVETIAGVFGHVVDVVVIGNCNW
jgi:hypothetical protein